jgi:plasmid stabilization system protein ParE
MMGYSLTTKAEQDVRDIFEFGAIHFGAKQAELYFELMHSILLPRVP